jgi:hypothetical protein
MAAFDHVLLLLSFVYALAFTHLLSCMAALIRAGARVRSSWFLSAWMLNALIVIVANWLSFFDLRAASGWNVATILFVLAMAIANYVQAALVCMDVPEEGEADMAAFHEAQARKYIPAFIVSLILGLFANIFLGRAFHVGEFFRQNAAVIPLIVFAAIATIRIRGPVQTLALIGIAGFWFYYFVFLQSALT